MDQNILEARIEFKNSQLVRVAVLVQISKGDVRAIVATTKPREGYMNIKVTDAISPQLLQDVADYGMETMDRDSIFKGWQDRHNKRD